MKTPREYREANVTYLVPPFTNTEDIFVRRYGLLPVVYKWKNVPTGRTGTHTVYLFPEDVKRFPNLLAHWNRTAEWKYTLTNSVLVVLQGMKYLLAYGSIADGFSHVGPFTDAEDADTWAQENVPDGMNWDIVELLSPE